MRLVLCLVVLGCGRYSFDERDGAPGDGAAAACTPVPEVCNGIDDDCNGIIDDGCPCTPFDVTAPLAATSSSNLIWTGQGYLTKTGDATTDYVQPISSTGVLGTAHPIGLKTDIFEADGYQAFAWTGTELALAWTRKSGQLALSRFDANGSPIGTPTDIDTTPNGFEPAITWAIDHFAVTWTDNRNGSTIVYLRELAADGTPLTPEVALPITGTVMQILPVAGHYLLDVGQTSEPSLSVEVGRDGTILGTATLAFPGSTTEGAHFAPGPGGFAATRSRNQTFDTVLMTLDVHGTPTLAATPLPTYNGHTILVDTLAGAPDTYVVLGATFATPWELVELEFDASGAITQPPELVTTYSAAGTSEPTVALADHRRGLGLPIVSPSQMRVVQQCR